MTVFLLKISEGKWLAYNEQYLIRGRLRESRNAILRRWRLRYGWPLAITEYTTTHTIAEADLVIAQAQGKVS